VEEFLRASDIRVTIDHAIEAHIDRAIELINRTNQLNFTKARLPEDIEAARDALREQVRPHNVQVGLVHVADRYGDHGLVGFYLVNSDYRRLIHFCFSCRILGMGVEGWLYEKLQRPWLEVVGEVLSNPAADGPGVTWINSAAAPAARTSTGPRQFDWVVARGGCELSALMHYFALEAGEVHGEFNIGRHGFDARIDHSMFLRYAIDGLPEGGAEACGQIGYLPEHFDTALFQPRSGRGLFVLGFWADYIYALYRHRRLDLQLPWARPGMPEHWRDGRAASLDELPAPSWAPWMPAAIESLHADFDYVGLIDEEQFKENVRRLVGRLPGDAPIVVLKSIVEYVHPKSGGKVRSAHSDRVNAWLEALREECPRIRLVDVAHYLGDGELFDEVHFHRPVYQRLFEAIIQEVGRTR
jgi:hypothetical protein